ncbi:unnamed protein product, partial [Didymodactylos carnosus]
ALDYAVQAEYNLLQKQLVPGCICIPSAATNLTWFGVHFVSQGPYQAGIFRFVITIPDNFPNGDCPRVTFTPSFYHPLVNIDNGELDVKRYFPVWKRNDHHIYQILRCIRRIFQKIETNNPSNAEAAIL